MVDAKTIHYSRSPAALFRDEIMKKESKIRNIRNIVGIWDIAKMMITAIPFGGLYTIGLVTPYRIFHPIWSTHCIVSVNLI
jgi:hypothetical protein